YVVTVNRAPGGTGAFDAELSVAGGLPPGATYSFTIGSTASNILAFGATDTTLTAVLTITTATRTPASSFTFTVQAARLDAAGDLTADLATGSGSLAVNRRLLTVTATGQNKVYDGTTTASVTLADDRVAGDAVNVTYTTANFGDRNVGVG